MYRRVIFSLLLSAACGASWMLPIHWVGPLLSLVFALLILFQRRGLDRYGVALAYYAAGSQGLLRGVAVFFGAHAPWWEGAFLWLGSATLLSLGWFFANRPWKVALVLLFDALVPPLSLFDWLSPLSAAGLFYPGLGMAGILLFLLLIAGLSRKPRLEAPFSLRLFLTDAALFLALVANIGAWMFPSTSSPRLHGLHHWVGVSLHVGPAVPNVLTNQARHNAILRQTLAQSKGAKVVLLPETLETAWAGNLWAIRQAIPKGQTWLMGMSVPRQVGILTDSIVELRRNRKPTDLFNSTFPVPVSMWHPWSRGTGYVDSQNVDYEAAWWTPARKIAGMKVWANICYDQLLPFVWIEGALQSPQVVLLTNNEWWAQGTGIPQIQRNTAWVWGKLLGAPEIEAENN
ncbi:conjugal transfer protein TraB [Acidithiobacillus sp. YTS05]|nr:conjugal transfer protein TraB [Acidithiobacillus sp. YTS05]